MKRIPTACITLEDAELMSRMAKRGHKIVVKLTMGATTLPDADSFNVVAEIKGREHPEQVEPTLPCAHTHAHTLTCLTCCSVYLLIYLSGKEELSVCAFHINSRGNRFPVLKKVSVLMF